MVIDVLHEMTNEQLKCKLNGDYFVTVTAVFLQFVITVPAVLPYHSHHTCGITIEFSPLLQ